MNIGNGIGSAGLISTVASNATAEVKQAAKTQEVSTSPVKADATTLTSTASVIAQGLSAQDGRASQVEAIQAAIAAGTYHVPAAAVADKLIESMLG